ncbi:MAG: hypothetical protein ACREOB_08120 [Thermodesulfobacteriota bacterium]
MDLPFEILDRTQFADEGYGILGRALAFGTDFEANCRACASIIGLKSQPEILIDEKSINEFCRFIFKRGLHVQIQTLENKLKLPEDVSSLLSKGRESRNYLAHEAGLGLRHILENNERRENFINDIKAKVSDIAEANLIILFLTNIVTNEPNPTLESLKKYVGNIIEWVCEVE